MKILIDIFVYLGWQELGFRGHNKSITSHYKGNFTEFLDIMMSNSSVEIRKHYENICSKFSGESIITQNESTCISDYMNDFVAKELKKYQFFSIQVDDTTDLTQKSQYSVIVHFLNEQGELVERFLGFHDISDNSRADTSFTLLNNLLEKFDYKNKLIAQCNEEAAVISGHLNGRQQKIKTIAN